MDRNPLSRNNEPMEIFAGNILEAGMVQGLLESAGLNSYLKDEFMGTLNPWYVAAGGMGSVKVIVSPGDYNKAREIVGEYKKNTNR